MKDRLKTNPPAHQKPSEKQVRRMELEMALECCNLLGQPFSLVASVLR